VLLKTVMSPLLTISALVASYLLFRGVMRRDDVDIRWGPNADSPALVEATAS
jgi:hypothetical protein